jgi:biotin carboxylase
VLKPRSEASAIGIKKIDSAEALWPILESLGDQQSSFLLEQFVPGDVYHVDSVVSELEVVFSSVSRYGQPPMAVAQQGGIFTTYLLPGDSEEALSLRTLNRDLITSLGLVRGVSHAEFIRARSDGNFNFLECAARVGGAYISDMVETATGINLWREWARIEIAGGKQPYQLPAMRSDYAGIILSLSRQKEPDTSAYNDPEIVQRLKKRHHAGLVLRSSDPDRIQALLQSYASRFAQDFLAIVPPGTKPAA